MLAATFLRSICAVPWLLGGWIAPPPPQNGGTPEAPKPNGARQDPGSKEVFEWLPGGTYEPNVSAPAKLLGYPLGTRFTEHHRLLEVVRSYAQINDRAVLEKYGETEEHRPLYLAYISTPENLKALKQVRADLQTLIESRTLDKKGLDDILDRLPVVVWLSFNVHGNEPSSSEAALALIYQLVAGTDARTETIRKNAIVVVDPCVNPDGRERYVRWFNGIVGVEPDPMAASWEHDEPWPGGRVNHYFFDLNRDWAFLTQVESRARIAAYLLTPPQVHVDFHEMGASSTYFFFPPEYPVNSNLPGDVVDWAKVFGSGNAAAFDKFGWAYYTRENFDLFYPGYGDSWPTFQGAVGMTYEQAGHSTAGLALKRDDEQVLTLRDRASHHFIAAFATCETAAARRKDLTRRFREWHRTAMEEGETGAIREYAILEGNDPARAAALASLLLAQGIQVFRAGDAFVAGPLRDFDGKEFEREAFPAGTYLVPLSQPRKRLANALLEPAPQLKDLYFYDVSAWSLPRAFGVKAFQLGEPARVKRAPYDGTTSKAKPIDGDVKGAYAFLLDWRQGNAPRFVAAMLADGARVSYATKEFETGGRTWGRGTAVIPVLNNGENLTERARVRAEEAGVTLVAVSTGLSEEGIDLGSDQVRPLKSRRVALLVGPQVSPSSFGAIRYLLERSYRIPFSVIPLENLPRARLGDFGTIVFPDGGGFDSAVNKETVVKLREWATAGGTIVAMGGSAFWATADRSGLTRIRPSKAPAVKDEKRPDAGQESAPRPYVPADQREALHRRSGNPGAILKLDMDPASSVVFGCGDGPLYVLATNEQAFDPDSGQVAAIFTIQPKAAGFVGSDAASRLAGQAFAVTERIGRGRAVLFSEDPNFRLVWQGLSKAFLNALLLP
jgi:hypothetical protein